MRRLLALGTAAAFSFRLSEQKWGGESPPVPSTPASSELGGSSRWGGTCSSALLGCWRGGCTCDGARWTWQPWQGREGIGKCRKRFCRHLVSPGSGGSIWCDSDKFGPRGAFSSHWITQDDGALLTALVHHLPYVWRWVLVFKFSIWGNSCQIMALMLVVNLLLLERAIWSICFLRPLVVQGIMEENRKPGLLSKKIWLELI